MRTETRKSISLTQKEENFFFFNNLNVIEIFFFQSCAVYCNMASTYYNVYGSDSQPVGRGPKWAATSFPQ